MPCAWERTKTDHQNIHFTCSQVQNQLNLIKWINMKITVYVYGGDLPLVIDNKWLNVSYQVSEVGRKSKLNGSQFGGWISKNIFLFLVSVI